MKTDYSWPKTLLIVYRYLERIAGAIDKIIEKTGLASSNICEQNYFLNNTFAVSQRIIKLSQRKITIINLKILIEQTLKKIDSVDAVILIEKYIDGLKFREIMDRHNFSMRTAFRKTDVALKSFACALSASGFGDRELESMLENEDWVLFVRNRLLCKNDDDFILPTLFLKKAVAI